MTQTLSKDTDEQLKLAHKMVDGVDRANRKICVTLLRYRVDKPKTFYAHTRLITSKKEDEKFQHIVFMNHQLEDLSIYLM